MSLTTKILISAPSNGKLDQRQQRMANAIRRAIEREGFEIQEFGRSGLPQRTAWSFENVQKMLRRCQGIVILGFNIGNYTTLRGDPIGVVTEYNHIEGTLALAQDLPILIIREANASERGILSSSAADYLTIPAGATSRWVLGNEFKSDVLAWRKEVEARHHVFLGYSSGARMTASRVKSFLQSFNVRIMDWMTDFKAGGTVLDEIQQAEKLCMGGIFLFTKDDEINSKGLQSAAPRDNVIFEAGYFMNSKGKERTLLICEEGVKIPADVGGNIYLPLKDRHDISTIENDLRKFVEDRF